MERKCMKTTRQFLPTNSGRGIIFQKKLTPISTFEGEKKKLKVGLLYWIILGKIIMNTKKYPTICQI